MTLSGDSSETVEMTSTDMIFEPILEHGVFRFDCSVDHRKAAFPSVSFKNSKDREVPIVSHIVPAYIPTCGCLQDQQVVTFEFSPGTSFYGTGEVSGQLERTGKRVFTWNTDAWGYGSGTTSLYQSHPWVLVVLPTGETLGVLADTTRKCEIDLRKEGIIRIISPACNLAPFFIFLLQWMDFSCLLPRYFDFFHILIYKVRADGRWNRSRYGRKATIREFYGVILPSLERLHINFADLPDESLWYPNPKAITKKQYDIEGSRYMNSIDLEREDECGICLEPCTKMVLPNCCHAMCIKCYRNWNTKLESCPFCRGSIKRVNSEDLWVLTCDEDVVDPETVTKEDLLRFYLHINSLPKDYPEAAFLVYNEYLI